jgi:hypothetical protein
MEANRFWHFRLRIEQFPQSPEFFYAVYINKSMDQLGNNIRVPSETPSLPLYLLP